MVDDLERRVHDARGLGAVPSEFVVPGQSRTSAALDLARTVVRRAERLAVALRLEDGSQVVPYLNRLSDLCWLLARSEEHEHLTAAGRPCSIPPDQGMMTAMHAPLTLPTHVSDAAPRPLDAVGWGAFEGLETARPGLELDVAWCERRRYLGQARRDPRPPRRRRPDGDRDRLGRS